MRSIASIPTRPANALRVGSVEMDFGTSRDAMGFSNQRVLTVDAAHVSASYTSTDIHVRAC